MTATGADEVAASPTASVSDASPPAASAPSACDLGLRPGPVWLSPVVAWAVAGWIGCLLGWAAVGVDGAVAWPTGPWAIGGQVAIGVLVGLVLRGADAGWRAGRRSVAGVLLACVVFAGLAGQRRMQMTDGPLLDAATAGQVVSVRATVASEPDVTSAGTAWSLVTVTRVDGRSGRWRALWADQPEPVPVGTVVDLVVLVRSLDDAGFEGWLRRRHAAVQVQPSAVSVVRAPSGVLGWVERVRERTRTAAAHALPGDEAGLAVGLVTGDTRLLSEPAHDDMRAAGLTHLVAVSGSNVALVAGAVALAAAGVRARLRRGLVVIAIVLFVVTTRADPSVLRAAVMAGAVHMTAVAGRPRDSMQALAVAVLCLLVADPVAAGSLGLTLSVAATMGVVVLAPMVLRRLSTRLPLPVAGVVAATIGAQVAVAPVLLAVTSGMPLAALPANLVAVPTAAMASAVAAIGAVVAQVHVAGAGWLFGLARPGLWLVLATARTFGAGPSLRWTQAVVAAAVGVVLLLARRSRAWRMATVATGVVVLVGAVVARPGSFDPPDALAVTAIDVGQGDALLITTASGHRILVDTGRDARAATWLRQRGVRDLDLLVITHPDADHAGGLDEVLQVVTPRTIWTAVAPDGTPTPVWPDHATTQRVELPSPPVPVHAGMRARLGSAGLEVLSPPPGRRLTDTAGGRNDRSVVLRVREGERVLLAAGDVEVAGQRRMLATDAALRADLLVVPHHGAGTSVPAFLRAVAPGLAVVSVGADNDYGHPHPDVVQLLEELQATVMRTDLHGTVTIEVPP